MCDALPLRRITFRFKKSEYGWEATTHGFTIYIGRNSRYFWWSVEKKGFGQIAESDFAYKTDALTFKQAAYRAKRAVQKYRINHD